MQPVGLEAETVNTEALQNIQKFFNHKCNEIGFLWLERGTVVAASFTHTTQGNEDLRDPLQVSLGPH